MPSWQREGFICPARLRKTATCLKLPHLGSDKPSRTLSGARSALRRRRIAHCAVFGDAPWAFPVPASVQNSEIDQGDCSEAVRPLMRPEPCCYTLDARQPSDVEYKTGASPPLPLSTYRGPRLHLAPLRTLAHRARYSRIAGINAEDRKRTGRLHRGSGRLGM